MDAWSGERIYSYEFNLGGCMMVELNGCYGRDRIYSYWFNLGDCMMVELNG
jgi:hypothetical protein